MDQRLLDLLPHRPPMLLLDRFIDVNNTYSQSEIHISQNSSFFVDCLGVPSWVAIEYMGQTAALIAGFQLEQGTVAPHVGFLLGTRKFQVNTPYFENGLSLMVSCTELAVVGESLATFDCRVQNVSDKALLAEAKLSVFRKPIDSTPL